MPSLRRIKVFSLLIVIAVVTTLLYRNSRSSSLESSQAGDFFRKTKSALERTSVGGGASTAGKGKVMDNTGNSAEDKEASRARLKEAAQLAKDLANLKSPKPDPPSTVVGVGSAAVYAEKSVAGRKKFNAGGSEAQTPVKEEEGPEDEVVKEEFNIILKKAPIIIFSKSYCPHSARAKGILLQKYLIDPKPYVVELDKHKLGAQLQAKLADLTGRKTVPNVLINGMTIGGGDDVAELDSSGKLVAKIMELGGKRMVEVKLRPIEEAKEQAKEKVKVKEDKGEGHGL